MIIAIDGPAASGKGTLARRLAAYFDMPHLDAGGIILAATHTPLGVDDALELRLGPLRASTIASAA